MTGDSYMPRCQMTEESIIPRRNKPGVMYA